MSARGPSLLIFDCDGTLVDSQNMIVAAMSHAYGLHGLAMPERAEVLSIVGLSLVEAVRKLRPDDPHGDVVALAETYKLAFTELRRDKTHHEPMFEGARDMLDRLVGVDRALLGVATGKSRRGVDAFFDREGLHRHFLTVQTADCAPSKPHPAMIRQAMDELGAVAERTVMIGDTTFDVTMARNAGVKAIGVEWGYHDSALLHAAGADHVADDMAELDAMLHSLLED